MKGAAPRPLLSRMAYALLALVLFTAVPGVAIASLPVPPPPTHDCCAADAPPMDAACGEAPCCIQKPAPRAPSVLTGALQLAPTAAAPAFADATPAAPEVSPLRVTVVPRARSAPLFVLFVTLLI